MMYEINIKMINYYIIICLKNAFKNLSLILMCLFKNRHRDHHNNCVIITVIILLPYTIIFEICTLFIFCEVLKKKFKLNYIYIYRNHKDLCDNAFVCHFFYLIEMISFFKDLKHTDIR